MKRLISIVCIVFAVSCATGRNTAGYWNGIGLEHKEAGRYVDAEAAFKRAISLKPDNVKAERFEEAIEIFRDALEINPDDPQTRFGLGVVHLMKGDREAALEEYKVLRRLDKQLAERLFDLILR
jgi:tetratricopeptide (TPR) repeat protein